MGARHHKATDNGANGANGVKGAANGVLDGAANGATNGAAHGARNGWPVRSGATGLHVGIIMDGNGRWAAGRGQNRYYGHRAGARAVRDCVRAAPDLGIRILTLYAFSANNWKRPEPEVRLLLRLFERYLHDELRECVDNGVRLQVIGRRDRLGPSLLHAIATAERVTGDGQRLLLRVAIDYSARHAIMAAAARLGVAADGGRSASAAGFGELVAGGPGTGGPFAGADQGEVDLIIRTGGEQRLSDFLLWEAAYAELYFTDVMWPEFGRHHLQAAVAEFHHRERRFGCINAPAPRAAPAAALSAGASR